jgi:hypothetical protein
LDAVGIVSVPIILYVNREELVVELRDALYVPGLGANLYSIEVATELGINVDFHEDEADFLSQDNWIIVGQKVGKSLYQGSTQQFQSRNRTAQNSKYGRTTCSDSNHLLSLHLFPSLIVVLLILTTKL